MHRSTFLTSLAAACALTTGLTAQTVVNIPCAADNMIYENAASTSNGKGATFLVGLTPVGVAMRALLRFDVAAAVPAGATIVGARLVIHSEVSNGPGTLDITGHRLLQAWGEGNSVSPMGGGIGAPATTGDATWTFAFFNTTSWTTAGGDFAAPSFVIPSPPFGTTSSPDGPGTVADVQSWLDNPAQNFGWLLKSDETLLGPTARRYTSRDSGATTKPFLRVEYLLPGDVGTWGTGCPTTFGTFDFAWVGPMVGGTTVQRLHTDAPPNSVGASYFSLDLFQPGALLLPACNLYLPITVLIPSDLFLTDAAGVGSPTPWNVPTIYPGLYFTAQSIVLDGSPLGLALSNAGVAVIQ